MSCRWNSRVGASCAATGATTPGRSFTRARRSSSAAAATSERRRDGAATSSPSRARCSRAPSGSGCGNPSNTRATPTSPFASTSSGPTAAARASWKKPARARATTEHRSARRVDRPRSRARGDRVAQALLLLAQLAGRIAGRELLRLEDLANLDLFAGRERRALDPFHHLARCLRLQQPVTGDQLLGLGEGTVGDSLLPAREADTHPLGARVQPLTRQHDAGLDQLLVELAHRGKGLLVWKYPGLGLLRRLHNHHETHRHFPC